MCWTIESPNCNSHSSNHVDTPERFSIGNIAGSFLVLLGVAQENFGISRPAGVGYVHGITCFITSPPLAPKTVRHIGTLLHTTLSEVERLGYLKIPHPMANKRVKLPKLPKRKPAVLDPAKLGILFERARGTRLYPFMVLAAENCSPPLGPTSMSTPEN